jgi:serine/threonine protein kinase
MGQDDFTAFIKAEYETLDMLRGFDTPHLIKAIAFYCKDGNRYFVFPWAQHGNLWKFWNEKVPSIHDNNYMKWVFDQFLGLAEAIRTLHDQNDGKSCRHGDLKPENILCFNSSRLRNANDHTSCVLVVSDVGLARTHSEATDKRSKTKMQGGETARYRAPEIELFPNHATGRRYDIWSLGCLYLEFIIWLLYGIEKLVQFRQDIDGKFYKIVPSHFLQTGSRETAMINENVQVWINRIKADPRCAGNGSKKTALGRLIAFVEKRLLVVVTKQSMSTAFSRLGTKSRSPTYSSDGVGGYPVISVQAPTMLEDDLTQKKTMSQFKAGSFAIVGDERAYAREVYETIQSITNDAKHGEIDWLNLAHSHEENVSHHVR